MEMRELWDGFPVEGLEAAQFLLSSWSSTWLLSSVAPESEICDKWHSAKGSCHIFRDHWNSMLAYEEHLANDEEPSLDGNAVLSGWLQRQDEVVEGCSCRQAEMFLLPSRADLCRWRKTLARIDAFS